MKTKSQEAAWYKLEGIAVWLLFIVAFGLGDAYHLGVAAIFLVWFATSLVWTCGLLATVVLLKVGEVKGE